MSKVFNMVGGGGKNISSIVITGLDSINTVTCTKDGKSYAATWDDTAKHWEIVGLPLGTFTVTATNGTKTTTETVLIDIAGVYEIEMDFIPWLYKDGDECESATGGWVSTPFQSTAYHWDFNSGAISKATNDTNLAIAGTSGDAKFGSFYSAKAIDLTNVSKIKAKINVVTAHQLGVVWLGMYNSVPAGQFYHGDLYATCATTNAGTQEFSLDVSSISGEKYILIGVGNAAGSNWTCSVQFERVWLE